VKHFVKKAALPAALLAATLAAPLAPARAAQPRAATSLTVWTYLGSPATKAVQQLANQWAKGKNATVKVIINPATNQFQGFSSVAHTGKGPDIGFAIPADNLGTFHLANLIAQVPSGIFTPSQYVPQAAQAVTFNGKYYAAPLNIGTYELVYNKSLVSSPPKTWDQLFTMAKKFPNTKGKTFGFFEDWTTPYFAYSIIRGFGGYYLKQTPTGVNPNDIGVDTPGAIKGLQFIESMYTNKIIPADVNSNVAGSFFQKGQLAMWIDGTWDIGVNSQALGGKFGAEPLPMLPGGLQPHPFSSDYAAFVNSYSKNQSMAWDLIKYLSAKYPLVDLKIDGSIPSQKSLLDSAAVQGDPILAGYAKTALAAEPIPNAPQMQAVWTPVMNQITLLSHGKVTPAQAGANMLTQIKQGEAQLTQ